jgi:hypothetical protein
VVSGTVSTPEGPLHLVDLEQVIRRVTRQINEVAAELGARPPSSSGK